MGYEKRRHKRRHLVFYLEVIDPDEQRVGWVADITHEGMMLVASKPLSDEVKHSLTVKIPEELGIHAEEFTCLASIQWVRPDRNPDYVLMGCRFCDIPRGVQAIIDELINVCAFDDARFIHPNEQKKR